MLYILKNSKSLGEFWKASQDTAAFYMHIFRLSEDTSYVTENILFWIKNQNKGNINLW